MCTNQNINDIEKHIHSDIHEAYNLIKIFTPTIPPPSHIGANFQTFRTLAIIESIGSIVLSNDLPMTRIYCRHLHVMLYP